MVSGLRVTAATFVGWLAVLGLTACGGGAATTANGDPGGGGNTTPPTPTYTVGGTISGASSTGLVLLMNGTSLAVAAGTNNFLFSTELNSGATYAVTVSTQPSGMLCSVANGSGTIGSANVSNVVVTCSTQAYSLGGSITGLTVTGLVLGNGSDQLTIGATDTSFTFHTMVAFSSSYSVKVVTQPNGQACAVTNGDGTMGGAAVTNVTVTCTSQPFTLGGAVSGLTSTGLVLLNSATSESLPITAAGSFTFTQPVAFGTQYIVSVGTQPAGQMCTVSSGSGKMPASNLSNVTVTCSDKSYHLGGTISGVSTTGLSLTNGTDTVAIGATDTAFTFPTAVAFNAAYSVTIATKPTGYSCSVSSNGTAAHMPAQDVTNIAVTCSINSYTLSGQINGLTGSGITLANGTDHLMVASGATIFSLAGVPYNASYTVTVFKQPTTNLKCVVTSGGSGVMPAGNVNNVVIDCTPMQWTWESGANTIGAGPSYPVGGYGGQGDPGARDSQMTWTDSDGHFWMFGGSLNAAQDIDDVWAYDPTAQTWTWVNGYNTPLHLPSYGTKGSAAAGNTPGARHSAATWSDASGHLWLFGGSRFDGTNYVYYNDLWSFDTATKLWTWVAGPQTTNDSGSYNTINVADGNNLPPSRSNGITWVDATGKLWLFGGLYIVSGSPNAFNDAWVYDPVSGYWTWAAGPQGLNGLPSYGALNTASGTNVPGARAFGSAWVDKNGLVWMFGGAGIGGDGSGGYAQGYLNDLWNFDTSSHAWVWVGGQSDVNGPGTYSTPQLSWPGARAPAFVGMDSNGKVWMFGGSGYGDAASTALNMFGGSLNDFWNFDTTTGQWTSLNNSTGVDAPGVYPAALGTGGASYLPGARSASAGWVDTIGHIWLFGGSGRDSASTQGDLNDVWKY